MLSLSCWLIRESIYRSLFSLPPRSPNSHTNLTTINIYLKNHSIHEFTHSDIIPFIHVEICQNRIFHSLNETVHTNLSQNLCFDFLRHDTYLIGLSSVSYRTYWLLYLSIFVLFLCSTIIYIDKACWYVVMSRRTCQGEPVEANMLRWTCQRRTCRVNMSRWTYQRKTCRRKTSRLNM